MTTEIKITADERLLSALTAIAGALAGTHTPEPATPPVTEPAEPAVPAATAEAAVPAVDEATLRAEIKQLGITAIRAKKADAVKALLGARGLTELREIPACDLEAFKAEMEACLA